MTRHLWRLVAIGAVIVGTGAGTLALGHDWRTAVLWTLLAAALSFAPTLLALEGIARARHPETFPPGWGERADKHLPTRTDEP